MRKLLLLSGMGLMAYAASAQDRLSLYEEFTGENCGPCASANPGLWQLMNQHDNAFIIKYQVPIPTGGPIYQQNTGLWQNRKPYYNIGFAPEGRLDGIIPVELAGQQNAGRVDYLTSAIINNAASIAPVFDVEFVGYDRTLGSSTVDFDVKITALEAFNSNNASLRVAVIESLFFATPPGTNGEKEFYNVIREMYPSPSGQAINTSFANGQSQTFTFSADLPSYVDPNDAGIRFVAFVQDNTNKKVLQAAVSPTVAVDLQNSGISSPYTSGVECGEVGDLEITSKFKNIGALNVTSVDLYVRTVGADGTPSAWVSETWTGNLAAGESATHTYSATVPGMTGVYMIEDSIGNINGVAPLNTTSKTSGKVLTALSDVPGDHFPYSNNFETASSRTEMISMGINGGQPFNIYSGSGYGYQGSTYFLAHLCYQLAPGSSGVAVMPYMNLPEGKRKVTMQVAYKQYQNEKDRLDVVYSTDCGATWTSVWNKSGTDLAAGKAPTTSNYLASPSDYVKFEVDITNVPDGAYLGIKATSDYGNNIFVDNITVEEGEAIVSTEELVNETNFVVYPNPATDIIKVDIKSSYNGEAQIAVYDIMGRQVENLNVQLNGNLVQEINVADLASGVYTIQIITPEGNQQAKFTKVK